MQIPPFAIVIKVLIGAGGIVSRSGANIMYMMLPRLRYVTLLTLHSRRERLFYRRITSPGRYFSALPEQIAGRSNQNL